MIPLFFLTLCLLHLAEDAGAQIVKPQETIDDPDCGFQLKLPARFVDRPELPLPPALKYQRVLDDGKPGPPWVVIGIQQFPGTIGRERLKPSDLPPNVKAQSLSTTRWKGEEVDVIEVEIAVGGFEMTDWSAQIPLRKKALVVHVAGPSDRRDELKGYLLECVANLEGQSSWTSAANPPPAWSTYVVIGYAIVLVILMWFIARYTQRGVAFLLGIGLWVAGNSLDPGPNNETGLDLRTAMLLVGLLKMAGSIGFLVALIEYFIPRAESAPVNPLQPMPNPGQIPPIQADVVPEPKPGALPPVQMPPNPEA